MQDGGYVVAVGAGGPPRPGQAASQASEMPHFLCGVVGSQCLFQQVPECLNPGHVPGCLGTPGRHRPISEQLVLETSEAALERQSAGWVPAREREPPNGGCLWMPVPAWLAHELHTSNVQSRYQSCPAPR